VKQSYIAGCLDRKWPLRFLLVHGEAYGFDDKVSPTLEIVRLHPIGLLVFKTFKLPSFTIT